MGTAHSSSGLHKAVITMLIESAALYAVVLLLLIGTWSASSPAQFIFLPILAEIQVCALFTYLGTLLSNNGGAQVIAPFLIILRVADRRVLTSEIIVSGNIGSIHFRSEGKSTVGNGSFPDGGPVGSTDVHGETPQELGPGTEIAIEEVSL